MARLTVCLALAATLGGALASSAHAQNDRHDGWREHERHDTWREHERHDGWREHEGHDEWRHRPDIYYSAPPVVVAPRGYYVQPGATLSFGLPFYR